MLHAEFRNDSAGIGKVLEALNGRQDLPHEPVADRGSTFALIVGNELSQVIESRVGECDLCHLYESTPRHERDTSRPSSRSMRP